MDWNAVFTRIDDPAIIVAVIAAIVTIFQVLFAYYFSRKLKGLEQTHAEQLVNLQSEANVQLENVRSKLDRVERLEEVLVKSRFDGYGEIWELTGALNLFGPTDAKDSSEFSTQLKDWYFEYGQVVLVENGESKHRYSLVQEILNFGILHSISYKRPADDVLYGSSEKRPVDVLHNLRFKFLGVEARDPGEYKITELETYVNGWKSQILTKKSEEAFAEMNWVLLQLLLSEFRSYIIKELQVIPIQSQVPPPEVVA